MSTSLGKEIDVELAQIDRLMQRHPDLLRTCRSQTPSLVEIDALAALLHSFYSGLENIFKRISIAKDDGPPTGEYWHADLLESMLRPTRSRQAVVSESLRPSLRRYLNFRHVFRHAYSSELSWSKMRPLVLELEEVHERLKGDLRSFQRALEEQHPQSSPS